MHCKFFSSSLCWNIRIIYAYKKKTLPFSKQRRRHNSDPNHRLPPPPRNINNRQKIKCCLVMCWKMLRPHKKNKNRNKAFIFLTNKARAAQPPLQSRCSSLVLHQGATLSFRCRCSLPLPPPPTPPPPHLPHPPLFSHPSSLGTQTQR